MKNHSVGVFEDMRVYLTETVGGKQKSGAIRAQSGTVKASHFFRLHQFEYTRIHYSALLDSHGRSALNSRWLHSP